MSLPRVWKPFLIRLIMSVAGTVISTLPPLILLILLQHSLLEGMSLYEDKS